MEESKNIFQDALFRNQGYLDNRVRDVITYSLRTALHNIWTAHIALGYYHRSTVVATTN